MGPRVACIRGIYPCTGANNHRMRRSLDTAMLQFQSQIGCQHLSSMRFILVKSHDMVQVESPWGERYYASLEVSEYEEDPDEPDDPEDPEDDDPDDEDEPDEDEESDEDEECEEDERAGETADKGD